jgi:hypothetical protein
MTTGFTPAEHLVQLRIDKFKLELPRYVAGILADVPHENVRRAVRELALLPNDVLPKRRERPHALSAYAVQLIGRAFGLRDEPLDTLIRMAIAFVEAGDIYDDVVDGDVRPGHEHRALAVCTSLHFVATRCALRLGPRVAQDWLAAMQDLPHALLLEKDGDGSLPVYLEAVQAQATLFGALAQAAGNAAGAEPERVARAANLAKLMYGVLQYLQDQREAPREVGSSPTSSLAANIMRHLGTAQVLTLLAQAHRQMVEDLVAFAPGHDTDRLNEFVTAMRPRTGPADEHGTGSSGVR